MNAFGFLPLCSKAAAVKLKFINKNNRASMVAKIRVCLSNRVRYISIDIHRHRVRVRF